MFKVLGSLWKSVLKKQNLLSSYRTKDTDTNLKGIPSSVIKHKHQCKILMHWSSWKVCIRLLVNLIPTWALSLRKSSTRMKSNQGPILCSSLSETICHAFSQQKKTKTLYRYIYIYILLLHSLLLGEPPLPEEELSKLFKPHQASARIYIFLSSFKSGKNMYFKLTIYVNWCKNF